MKLSKINSSLIYGANFDFIYCGLEEFNSLNFSAQKVRILAKE